MPKKFVGENSKSVLAKARKAAVKQEEEVRRQRQIEDEYWRDDDKHVLKKQQRKDDKDKKKQEQLEKKLIAKKLLQTEMDSIKATCKPESRKLTRAEIISQVEQSTSSTTTSKSKTVEAQPLVENLNRLSVDGEEARTIDEALNMLNGRSKVQDLHPERRIKASYAAFEAENLDRLKKEYPELRLSQIKERLLKEFMKSSANPLNNV